MKLSDWPAFQKIRELLQETAPEPEQMLSRLLMIERDIILPIKAVVVGLMLYSGLFFPHVFVDVTTPRSVAGSCCWPSTPWVWAFRSWSRASPSTA